MPLKDDGFDVYEYIKMREQDIIDVANDIVTHYEKRGTVSIGIDTFVSRETASGTQIRSDFFNTPLQHIDGEHNLDFDRFYRDIRDYLLPFSSIEYTLCVLKVILHYTFRNHTKLYWFRTVL